MSTPAFDSTELDETEPANGLIASVVNDAQRLVSLEVALAKQEAKELAIANAIAAGVIGFGGLLVALGVLVALPTVVVWLVPWHWQAASAWAAAYLVIGLVLIVIAKAQLQLGLPPRTIESLKENKEWALRRMRSTSR